MRRDDKIRLQHMLDAANEAASFARGKKRSDLDDNRMLVLSLVKDIEIIGEAAFKSRRRRENNCRIFPGTILWGCGTAWCMLILI